MPRFIPPLILATSLAAALIPVPARSTTDAGSQPRLESPGQRIAAALALSETDPKTAAGMLEALRAEQPILDDYLLYLIAGIRGRSSEESERILLARLVEQHGASPVRPVAAKRLAELLERAGRTEELVALSTELALPAKRSEELASVALSAGRVLAGTEPKRAIEHLNAARRLAAGAPPALEAARIVGRLWEQHPELAPSSAAELWNECQRRAQEGDARRELECLDRFLSKFPRDRHVLDATLRRGVALSRTKGRIAAADWLEKRAAATSSRVGKARLLFAAAAHRWNANQATEARLGFERMLALATGIREEQRARFALGRIHEAARQYNAAASYYRKAAAGPDESLAHESGWRAAWVSYLAGNYEGAAWAFGKAAARARNDHSLDGGWEASLYWQARSLEKSGHKDRAMLVYKRLLEESPDGYYALLAEERTGLSAPPPRVEAPPDDPPHLSEPTLARSITRARELHRAGLADFTRREIAAGLALVGPGERRDVLPLLVEFELYAMALRTALDLFHRGLLSEEELYAYLYPHAFPDVIRKAAAGNGLDPFLVYSLIRQESAFDVRAVSRADACGLMQLLVPTARRVARSLGSTAVEREDLFVPERNIELGTAYLAGLFRRFDGDEVLVLAGYNAGERAAERWRDRHLEHERDEFIELISYRETRNYVKKVLRNVRNYRRLYGSQAVASGEGGKQSSR